MQATLDESRWAQAQARDKSADGRFWCVVETTGIYCRPSCPGRPLRKNVSFHDSLAEAKATGARMCKRCNPDAA